MIIIFGASGFIGKHLFVFYQNRGIHAIGTYCKNPQQRLLPFDLSKSEIFFSDLKTDNYCYGVITAGIASIDYHKTFFEECAGINSGTKRLIDILYNHKIVPVFLSTDFVFEGIHGNYKEDDETNPTTQYGRNKREIEDYIKDKGNDYLIIRLGKVYGDIPADKTLITEMVEQLLSGKEIKCAGDQIVSPTYVGNVVQGINKLIEGKARGTFHLSSPRTLSHYDIARFIYDTIPNCSGALERCSIHDFPFAEKRPLNTTLNSEKLLRMFKITYKPLSEDIGKIVRSYQ